MRRGVGEARNAHAGVDDQIAIATAHMPDIALHDPNHVRFPNARDAISEVLELEPPIGNAQAHRLRIGECSTQAISQPASACCQRSDCSIAAPSTAGRTPHSPSNAMPASIESPLLMTSSISA